MASKKKNKKKSTKSKKSAGRKATPAKKPAKKRIIAKKSAKKMAAPNKAVTKKKGLKKTASGKTARAGNNKTRNKSQARGSSAFPRETSGSRSGDQSGDLQGLSDVESVDSESVDELLEEGNAFEAGVVAGVENAGEHDEQEVRTHEVLEDDVPGEYLDNE
jgi:hypothetical protein